jgi:hypothetical protein
MWTRRSNKTFSEGNDKNDRFEPNYNTLIGNVIHTGLGWKRPSKEGLTMMINSFLKYIISNKILNEKVFEKEGVVSFND